MGSPLLPLPGSASWGNPTGVGGASNPVFEAENQKRLQAFTPQGVQGKAMVLGSEGANPFGPTDGSGKILTGAVAPQAGTTVVPSVASPTATTQFGYNTAPAASQAYPNFNIDPAVIGTWDKAYGKGTGKSMADLLGQISGAQAPMIQSFLKDIQPMFQDNLNNILESFAAGGQRFSSGAALAAGKFGADFTSHQQTLMSQVMQWAFGSYMNALNGFKGANPSTPATDWIKFGLGMAGTAGSALQGAGFGGSAIDVLAGL